MYTWRQGSIHGSDLGDMGMTILGHALSKHPGIVSLDVGDCKLSDMSLDVLYSLLLPVGNKPGLTELTLSDNPHISALGWAQFGMCLANCNCLRWLFLDYNPLGDYGASCVLVALAASQSVQVLDLEGCGLTEHTGQVMLHLVQNHLGGLSRVKLSNNRIRTSTLEAIRKHVSENYFDESCSVSTVSVDDLFLPHQTRLPVVYETSKFEMSSSSASSSKDSSSDSDSNSDNKKQGHLDMQKLKPKEIKGKNKKSEAEKQTDKEKKKELKKKKNMGKDEMLNDTMLTGVKGNYRKQEQDKSTYKKNQHNKLSEMEEKRDKQEVRDMRDNKNKNSKKVTMDKKYRQLTTSRGSDQQITNTGTSAEQAKIDKYENKETSVKQENKKSKNNICSNDELQQTDSGMCNRQHNTSRSGQDSDDTEGDNDKDKASDGLDSSGDELQEVSVFYK